MKEKWYLQTKKADFYKIAEKFNISPIIARLIRNRDIIEDEEIEEYLYSDIESLNSPWLFKDMDKAVDILRIKISQQNKIRIICDYDVDGICSGYILLRSFKELGANVDVVVPHRVEDGYGINERLIQKAFDDGVDTILTCDNGIAAYHQIEFAKTLGMTIIVTDHHEVPYEESEKGKKYIIPPADAVINQKQPDCGYPFKELCGAMVAYQLIAAIYDSLGKNVKETYNLLAYAALATVCDIVELKGENRTVVKFGLEQMHKINDIGINALIEACKIDKKSIDTYHFGFIIGPCLNASGRLDTAKKAMDLLHTKDREKADRLAAELRELNNERKDMTEKGTVEAIRIAEGYKDSVLVIFLPDCHESIAGIIAGRVREKYNKPTIVLTETENGVKGSGRSIEEYDMYSELTKVKELFTKYGGHKMAAGISLNKEKIEILRKRLNENCNLTEEDLYLKVWIDMQLPLEYVTMNLINELQFIAPWGKGNEKPLFAEKGLKVLKIQILGKTGNVLKLEVQNSSHYRMTAMIFSRTQEFMEFIMNKFGADEVNQAMEGKNNNIEIMATYFPKINEYNGMKQIQIIIDRFC
ncbi:MAG: single-stranded-DNA-specific exonuclease RecJ [Eubacterium sp.]